MSLIWTLYLIDVLNGLSYALGIVWPTALIVGLFFMIVGLVITSDDPEAQSVVRMILRTALILFVVALPLDIVIPGKNTMYAMAAVSVGEKLADNPAVQGLTTDGLKAVQHWINKQLAEEPKK